MIAPLNIYTNDYSIISVIIMSIRNAWLALLMILAVISTACSNIPEKENSVVIINPNDMTVIENNRGGNESSENIDIKDPESVCIDLGGTWSSEFKECEGILQDECEYLEGRYDECASACRHNPEAQSCTMQCIQLCGFE